MQRNLKEVFHEAAQLPERDRATLAGLLIETLDPISEPEVEAAWSEEIKNRLTDSGNHPITFASVDYAVSGFRQPL